jgi:alpha-ketoglutarate-dependent taurine dioxygenase
MPESLTVRPLAGALGAEVRGVRLGAMDDAEWKAVRETWLEHLVLFFPDQHLSHAEHVALGHRFGKIEIHPFIPKVSDEFPQIVVLETRALWIPASDVTFSDAADGVDPQHARCPERYGERSGRTSTSPTRRSPTRSAISSTG